MPIPDLAKADLSRKLPDEETYDDKLKAVFGGKSSVSMFEMTKLVSKHLK